MNKILFLCIATAILLFSIIVVNISPTNMYLNIDDWMEDSCKYLSDQRKYHKEQTYADEESKDITLKQDQIGIDRCNRKQAMVGLEYASLNINIVFGGICALLGLLHFLNVGSLGRLIGILGLGYGVVGFALTLAYVIESGLVFNDIDETNRIRIDSDGAFLKKDGNKYVCIYYKKGLKYNFQKTEKLSMRFSDYKSKILNYQKYLSDYDEKSDNYYKYRQCIWERLSPHYATFSDFESDFNHVDRNDILELCEFLETKDRPNNIDFVDKDGKSLGECDKVYFNEYNYPDNKHKIIYDRWLTSLILSCFIILFNIGLIIFGYLLYSDSNGLSGTVSIK